MSESIYCKVTKCLPLEISFELDFCIDGVKIYTMDKSTYLQRKHNESGLDIKGYLIIDSWIQIKKNDSYSDALLRVRPNTLIILSIISYLVDCPLTIYQLSSTASDLTSCEKPNKVEVLKLIHNEIDKSHDLLKILEAIYIARENTSRFVVSALSRWHKARYLEEESDANLHDDESFLVYFHVMELFSNYYNDQQNKEAKDKIKYFTQELFADTLKLRDSYLDQEVQEKVKAVYSILLSGGQIPIRSKIYYSLDQVDLLDPKTQCFSEQLVKIRNNIAHGNHVSHKDLIWPLPPFLSVNRDAEKIIFEMRVFTGRVIGAFLKIETWSDLWADIHKWLHPPTEYVKQFIRNQSFAVISSTDFIEGRIDGVRPNSLVEQFLTKKIKYKELETALTLFLIEIEVSEDNAFEAFEAAIILADSLNEKLSNKCKNLVATIHKNQLVEYSNIRDILREIENQGVKPSWFRNWIETGGHCS
jgi:hypothetical protein